MDSERVVQLSAVVIRIFVEPDEPGRLLARYDSADLPYGTHFKEVLEAYLAQRK